MISRRKFLQSTAFISPMMFLKGRDILTMPPRIRVGAHLWVYASKYPPDWDCTPIIEQVFSDLKYAGVEGLELMHINLHHDNSVERLTELSEKYDLPVIGTSYSADMWDSSKYAQIIEEVEMLLEKLNKLKASNFGISVGDARRKKTEKELDAQAKVLSAIRTVAKQKKITPNLHNHTYEVIDGMHDLRGTLKRIPDFPLGPDLNWLVRGGVDPVSFIKEFKKQIVYLHIRDQSSKGVWSEALGEGDTDFYAIAQALRQIDYSGPVTIELAFPNDFTPTRPVKESWRMSRQVVRDKFGY